MKHLAYALVAAVVLSGCGGGGGGPGSTDAGPVGTSAPSTHLDAYKGTWSSDCADHAVDTATILNAGIGHPSLGLTDAITIAIRTDYYINANCTGNIVATVTASADAIAYYSSSVDSPVVLTPGAAAVTVKIDKVTASLASHTATVSGTAVTHTVVNGQAQWCIDYGGGSSVCLKDEGTYPAQNGVAGGLYLQGNTLYELVPNGSVYTVEERFTRK